MLDAQTISAVNGFPVLDPSERLFVMPAQTDAAARKNDRGRKYLDTMIAAQIRTEQRVVTLRASKLENAKIIEDAIPRLTEADRTAAKTLIDEAIINYVKGVDKAMPAIRHAIKIVIKYKKLAIKEYPNFSSELEMVFDGCESACKDIADELVDCVVLLKSFGSELDEDARGGASFANPDDLMRYLARN